MFSTSNFLNYRNIFKSLVKTLSTSCKTYLDFNLILEREPLPDIVSLCSCVDNKLGEI